MDRLRTLWRKILPGEQAGQGCPIRDEGAVPEARQEREKLRKVLNERDRIDGLVVREFRARLSNDLRIRRE